MQKVQRNVKMLLLSDWLQRFLWVGSQSPPLPVTIRCRRRSIHGGRAATRPPRRPDPSPRHVTPPHPAGPATRARASLPGPCPDPNRPPQASSPIPAEAGATTNPIKLTGPRPRSRPTSPPSPSRRRRSGEAEGPPTAGPAAPPTTEPRTRLSRIRAPRSPPPDPLRSKRPRDVIISPLFANGFRAWNSFVLVSPID